MVHSSCKARLEPALRAMRTTLTRLRKKADCEDHKESTEIQDGTTNQNDHKRSGEDEANFCSKVKQHTCLCTPSLPECKTDFSRGHLNITLAHLFHLLTRLLLRYCTDSKLLDTCLLIDISSTLSPTVYFPPPLT
jgi:hypothetical protein